MPSDPFTAYAPDCDLPSHLIVSSGASRGGIPALYNPELVSAEPGPENTYLDDDDRVLGFHLEGEPIAVPHNILWYHEIVNLDGRDEQIAITYCPLTGSSLGFDRSVIAGQQLAVSGLLYMNNLVMFNRGEPESLWPQMLGEARCNAEIGRRLERLAIFEMSWGAWKSLYPGTSVVSSDVNISRDYARYPYGDYEQLDNHDFLFAAMPPLDTRRPGKERVIGLPSAGPAEPGVAFPFLALEAQPTSWAVVEAEWKGDEVVVLWADQQQGGGVFRPFHPDTGERLTFEPTPSGIVDASTGTRWSITGEGLSGALEGRRLESVATAYVAFWGAWAAFHPDTRLWEGGGI